MNIVALRKRLANDILFVANNSDTITSSAEMGMIAEQLEYTRQWQRSEGAR